MSSWHAVIPGPPMPWPRVDNNGRLPRDYVQWREQTGWQLVAQRRTCPFIWPVAACVLSVRFYFGWTRRYDIDVRPGCGCPDATGLVACPSCGAVPARPRHTRKPDVDNLAKAVLDCLGLARGYGTGFGIGLVSDDCQVDALLARKAWAPEAGHRHARTVVRVIVPSCG